MPDAGDATLILKRLSGGDPAAGNELLPIVYAELHRLATSAMGKARNDHTLQPTALLNEAWIRLIEPGREGFDGRGHFLAVAARAMRSVLVDHARRRGALKRGGGAGRVDLDKAVVGFDERSEGLVELDRALNELTDFDDELARIVDLRFFGGLKNPEIARALDMSLRSVERGWSTARAWLYRRVSAQAEGGSQ